MAERDYPAWICSRCGSKHGKHSRPWSTWHADTCGWCGKYTSCTEPRDFGYPPAVSANGEMPDRDLGSGHGAFTAVEFPEPPTTEGETA